MANKVELKLCHVFVTSRADLGFFLFFFPTGLPNQTKTREIKHFTAGVVVARKSKVGRVK